MHPNSSIPDPQIYANDAQHMASAEPAHGSASQPARSAVSHELHSFFADIEDLIKATTSLTGEDLEKAKAKLNERVSAAKASVEQMGNAVADGARTTARMTDAYVHDHPWQAVGAGAVIGLLLGVALGRRD